MLPASDTSSRKGQESNTPLQQNSTESGPTPTLFLTVLLSGLHTSRHTSCCCFWAGAGAGAAPPEPPALPSLLMVTALLAPLPIMLALNRWRPADTYKEDGTRMGAAAGVCQHGAADEEAGCVVVAEGVCRAVVGCKSSCLCPPPREAQPCRPKSKQHTLRLVWVSQQAA
jgi:hypothetical protein